MQVKITLNEPQYDGLINKQRSVITAYSKYVRVSPNGSVKVLRFSDSFNIEADKIEEIIYH